MSESYALQDIDLPIRHFIYTHFVDHARPPTTKETAKVFNLAENKVKSAYQRLNDNHFFFLDPGTTNIRMANPFSAVPTKFTVQIEQKTYWANCAWDMLGIPAALNKDAHIKAQLIDTNEVTAVGIQNGQITSKDEGVVHFPLPISQWYDDLILT